MQAGESEQLPSSWLDHELIDLALSVHDSAVFALRLADEAVTWASNGMGPLLDMPAADRGEVRARLGSLLEPLATAVRTARAWQEVELEQPLTAERGTRWIAVRARRVQGPGDEGEVVVGLVTDLSRPRGDRRTLAELADRYRLLVELSPVAIGVHQDGVVRYVNPALVSLIGAESDAAIVDRPVEDFVDARSLKGMRQRVEELTEPGDTSSRAQAELDRFDGGRVVVESVSVRTSWEGSPAFQVILWDVTSQRRAEAAIRYQAALVEHVSNAVVATDHGGVVTSWNPAAETVYGVRAEEAVGREVGELFGASLDPAALLARGGITEATHRHADGSPLTIRVSAAEMNEGFVLVCADETVRRRAEQDYATVVSMLGEGVLVLGRHGRITSANPAAQRVLEADEPNMLGCPSTAWPLFDESGTPLTADEHPSQRTRDTGEPERSRIVGLRRRSGETMWLECNTRALNPEDAPPHPVVVSFADVTEQRRYQESLRYQASHDQLTGLLNRKGLNDVLADLLHGEPAQQGAGQQGEGQQGAGRHQIGAVFCDIDNFKRINDSLGHRAGDELLALLAERLTRHLPAGCTAGRLSGDEFVFLCDDVEQFGGLEALMHWGAALMRTVVPVGPQLVHVTASTGAAMLDQSMTGDDLLRYADAAMLDAKRTGPGSTTLADPALLAAAEDRLSLEEQLRRAIEDDELALHFQPAVARSGAVVIAEALLRWPHPERGLLSPGAILPVAEQAGMLADLDRWVLRTALSHAAGWSTPDGSPVSVAVNLARIGPDKPGFVDEVRAAFRERGVDADRLVLEMVETALVELSDRSRRAMTELSAEGVRFAIDDFGTGYSSLTRLKDLPAQILKLDRRFVANLEHDVRDRAVAKAVVEMGHAMGHRCIAEGVETTEQAELLDHLDLDLYQGFLFARPVPADQFRDQLAAGHLFSAPRSE